MKKSLFLTLIFCAITLSAQEKSDRFTSGSNNQPHDPKMDQVNYIPNEVLLKFRDETTVTSGSRVKSAGINSVDNVLKNYGISSLEKLFPTAQKPLRARMIKSPLGRDFKVPRIDNIYLINIPQETQDNQSVNIHQIIKELKALPEIEYAEPNYIYSVDQLQPVGPAISAGDMARMQNNKQKINSSAVVPNDPLYSQQWYIPAVKANLVWEQTTGDTTQVIAILDTGVDWTHPDLTNKIWQDWNEIPDNGIDDDGNGLIDDYMGWDYINNDNNPMDDNSHGTHVAGIAAAEANNGIGIAGVNWGAKVMPIKVFQSSGRGDAATITQGIIYAAQKGATVINMSFGSYAESMTLLNALANAYSTSVLVAAAGNDNIGIGPCGLCFPMFPAAYSFVLGVQATSTGGMASFTNFDPDGPIFSGYQSLLNYELNAPGTEIMSCIPGGNYRNYSGTSMATPVVAGAVALYRELKPEDSQEKLFGNFINSSTININLDSALKVLPVPKLSIVSFSVSDTLDGNKDGLADVGETLELKVNVRTTWGQAPNVKAGIEFGEFEDQSTATILTSEATIGSLSAYATGNNTIPLKVKISPDVAHNRDIVFTLKTWYDDHIGETIQPITINVQNGMHLSGIISDTVVISSKYNWIVTGSLKLSPTGVLIIKPGTKLTITPVVVNDGKIIAQGKRDSVINIIYDSFGGSGTFEGDYTNLTYTTMGRSYLGKSFTLRNCSISAPHYTAQLSTGDWGAANFYDCLFSNNAGSIVLWMNSVLAERCNFDYNYSAYSIGGVLANHWGVTASATMNYCNFIHNAGAGNFQGANNGVSLAIKKSNFLNNINQYYAPAGYYNDLPNQYWGTTDSIRIANKINDFNDVGYAHLALVRYKPILTTPSDSCHAIVWKILVNGKDAQDEVIDPLGVGRQRFDIYFNRPMDVSVTPQVSFGVREPFNQQLVNEDPSWSGDSLIYTVYKTIKLTTGDGTNRIRVAGAKEANGWRFEIPVEDLRFNFVINAANSASTEFMATAGLGKVNLEWNNNDLSDGLGYNMYRMEHINDSTLTEPVIINSSLLTDTLYTDYSVVPNKKYYYYYKILRTNMVETDSSRVVSATPFTASKGDANGDLAVNVLDITTIVAYLLNNNPQPFIQEAADVNSDTQINVLDIVGVVNLVLNIPQNVPGIAMNKQVDLYLQNDTLFADSNVDIGAIQFDLAGIEQFSELEVLGELKTFESGNSYANGSLRVIFYSMSGKSIAPGQAIPLLKLKSGSMIRDVIIGEPNGSSVNVNYIKTRIPDITANMNQNIAELGQNYPNPVNGYTTIPIRIYEPVDEIVLRVVNMIGQEVEVIRLSNPVTGENLINWNPKQKKGLLMYKLEIRQGNDRSVCPAKRMMVL